MPLSVFRRNAHRNIIRNNGNFRLHIYAVGLVRRDNGIARANKCIRATLIHKRVGIKALGHLSPPRLTDEFNMVEIGRTIHPRKSARQRRRTSPLIKGKTFNLTCLKQFEPCLKLRGHNIPFIKRRLKRWRNISGLHGL